MSGLRAGSHVIPRTALIGGLYCQKCISSGLERWKGRRGVYRCVCGRSGVTRQGQGCVEEIRAEG